MPTPAEKLAQSLEVLGQLQQHDDELQYTIDPSRW